MVLLSNSDYPKILSIIHQIMKSRTIFSGLINFIVNDLILLNFEEYSIIEY